MSKIQPLSGFPEWLPEQELVQQQFLSTIRRLFELYGYTPLHTRAVEPLDVLLAKGETDKEIYVLRRLQAEAADEGEAELGLHFDLTVPFARFVAQNRGLLSFPFRRYQIQPVWRGERPQLGRYREFIQADIDVIGEGELEVRYDGEVVRVLHEVTEALPIPPVRLQVNNRKVLEGFYRGLGITDIVTTLRALDKLAKIGPDGVTDQLSSRGYTAAQIEGCLAIAGIEGAIGPVTEAVRALGVSHPLLDEGLDELAEVMAACAGAREGAVVAALHIARGLDYYTGTVVEGVFTDMPGAGSVCSGGRYDNLASMGSKQKLPGVGVSIGVSRMLGLLFEAGRLATTRRSPAQVWVIVHRDDERAEAEAVATALRTRGIPALVSTRAAGYGKQIKWADRLGIPYAWFPAKGDKAHEVKVLSTGAQEPASPDTWTPDPALTALRLLGATQGSS
ncbi:MAG: histidine--tRNA ligase [Alphaproteobacteria bacterium]|nr:histidine--tRNA ligase [Alphaproteobacteria bacterium]